MQLLQEVQLANDADAEEERGEGDKARGGSSASQVQRRAGKMSSMSGADDTVYAEFSTKSRNAVQHPLFKKFRR